MSDVNISPPAAPVAPAPAQHEVPIDPSPVSTPTPVGSQAPNKPPEQPQARADRRRETIDNAFKRARGEEPPPAKARMGHNNPPEPMEPEVNLKKPPPPKERERGDRGRFVAAQPAGQQMPQ